MASSEDTLTAYRIVAPRWASTAFSGDGARKHGGRWNSPGRSVVYVAGSRALAALEMLVHLTTPESRKKPYVILEVRIPSASIRVAGHYSDSRGSGDKWLVSGRSMALQIPSALIPEEPNFLLNPAHPDFRRIRLGTPTTFKFDQRF
jgi:RES domain-containing protein